MRIPLEALTQFLSGRPPEAKRTEPVAASADLGEAPQFGLRHWTPGAEQHNSRDAQASERGASEGYTQSSAPVLPPAREDTAPGFEERRKSDRRQQNIPVLLDTRLSPCRRKSDRQAAISLKA